MSLIGHTVQIFNRPGNDDGSEPEAGLVIAQLSNGMLNLCGWSHKGDRFTLEGVPQTPPGAGGLYAQILGETIDQ